MATRAAELRSPVVRGREFRAVTSGSTGKALTFWMDSVHEGWVQACQERGQAWWGLRPSDRAVILWGRPVDGSAASQWKTWALYRLRNRLAFNTFEELDDDFLESIARAVERFRPKMVYGYGSSIGALAQHLETRGRPLSPAAQPVVVQYTGDHMYAEERARASRAFGAPLASVYGSSEAGGTSQPCPHGRSHLSMDHILTEFLRDDGTPAEPDESAEIVVTTLNNYAMPLIRYRVGDRGRFSNEPCPCGNPLPWMQLDVGKVADLIRTSTRERVSPYFLDYLSKHLRRTETRGIAQFLVEQTSLDGFVVQIVKEEPFDGESIEFFTRNMKEHLGGQIDVEVRFVDHIPVSPSGKRRWFTKQPGWDQARATSPPRVSQ